jgi:predicted HTH transcriptional regulator
VTATCANSRLCAVSHSHQQKDAALEAYRALAPKTADPELAGILLAGEGPRIEFKSTLRWDVHEGRKNAELEKATVKTVAGFLNAEGGTLLLGVGDDGSAVGLENDYSTLQKANRDGFGLHLTSLVLERLGKDLAPCIALTFHRLSEKDVCRVEVRPSPRPVVLAESGTEVLYLRTGNSTRPLSVSELLAYEKRRWGASSVDQT